MRGLCDIVDEFFTLHDIKVNCSKSVHVVNKKHTDPRFPPPPIQLASDEGRAVTQVLHQAQGFRLLGAWLQLNGSPHAAVTKMHEAAQGCATVMKRHSVSPDAAKIIVNMVIGPRLTYLSLGSTPSVSSLQNIERLYLPTVKNILGLPRTFSTAPFFQAEGYGLNNLLLTVTGQHFRNALRLLNVPSKVSNANNCFLLDYRRRHHLPEFPLAPKASTTATYYTDWLRHMLWVRDLKFKEPGFTTAFTRDPDADTITVDQLLREHYVPYAKVLHHHRWFHIGDLPMVSHQIQTPQQQRVYNYRPPY
jgi:hypothetical protein